MPDEKSLRKYINTLDHMRYYFQELLKEEIKLKEKPASQYDYLKEFTDLKDMIRSGAWPLAVPAEALVSNDEDKTTRAQSIIEGYIAEDIQGKKFLEYGCGEGHTVDFAAELTEATGYDPKAHSTWASLKGTLTSDRDALKGPYDVILLYDVLDHWSHPEAILSDLKGLLAPEGSIYVRCHPWASRHATHIYRQANLAYIHLVCTEEELIKLGYVSRKTFKTIRPNTAYRGWFLKNGYKIVSEEITTTTVEDFFNNSLLARRIAENYWPRKEMPLEDMAIEFIDYIITI